MNELSPNFIKNTLTIFFVESHSNLLDFNEHSITKFINNCNSIPTITLLLRFLTTKKLINNTTFKSILNLVSSQSKKNEGLQLTPIFDDYHKPYFINPLSFLPFNCTFFNLHHPDDFLIFYHELKNNLLLASPLPFLLDNFESAESFNNISEETLFDFLEYLPCGSFEMNYVTFNDPQIDNILYRNPENSIKLIELIEYILLIYTPCDVYHFHTHIFDKPLPNNSINKDKFTITTFYTINPDYEKTLSNNDVKLCIIKILSLINELHLFEPI